MAKSWTHQRFERMVGEPNEKGCRLWLGCTKAGRAFFVEKTWPDRHCTSAQRYAYRFYKEAVPPTISVTNKCRNPLCVELTHLVLKSRSQLVQDAIKRGTFAPGINLSKRAPHHKGEQNGNCRHPASLVRQLVAEREQGAKIQQLSARHHLATSTVWWILTGRSR